MPFKARTLMNYGETLPELCMKLRMNSNGSSDELLFDTEERQRIVKILHYAMHDWKFSMLEREIFFDFSVYLMVCATLREHYYYSNIKEKDLSQKSSYKDLLSFVKYCFLGMVKASLTYDQRIMFSKIFKKNAVPESNLDSAIELCIRTVEKNNENTIS